MSFEPKLNAAQGNMAEQSPKKKFLETKLGENSESEQFDHDAIGTLSSISYTTKENFVFIQT